MLALETIILYTVAMATSPHPRQTARNPGRPREFVVDDMLEKAQHLFCERGYHATSVGDLKSAVGLTTGSIYKAFKDKRTLFLAAFDRYVATRQQRLAELTSGGQSGYDKLRITLAFYAESASGTDGARGCMVVGTAAELSTFDDEVAAKLKSALRRNEATLRKLIVLGQEDGSLPATVDADATAHFLLCLLQGMRVVGKAGASRAKMMTVVDLALANLMQ